MNLEIREDFRKLIPALSSEEYKQLEENCKKDGIRDSIVTWNNIIVDGHNRYKIALDNDLLYTTIKKEFDNENEVIYWMLLNQVGRRNLNTYQKGLLALELKKVLEVKAKENLKLAALKTNAPFLNSEKAPETEPDFWSPDYDAKIKSDKLVGEFFNVEEEIEPVKITPINATKEAAKVFGIGHDTLAKIQKIENNTTPEIKKKLENKEINIDAVYKDIRNEEKKLKIEETKKETIEKNKDVIIDNVIQGDSIIETLNCPNNIKVVLSDPPYGMNYSSNRKEIKDDVIINDESLEKALEITKIVYTNLYDKMLENSCLFSFIRWKEESAFISMIEEIGFKVKNSIIYVKSSHGSGDLEGSFSPRHERIIFAVKGNPKLYKRPDDVLFGNEIKTKHIFSKPIDLLKTLIEATSLEGDLIVDPFAGHGSTGIACKELNRNFWLCEQDEYNVSEIKNNLK